ASIVGITTNTALAVKGASSNAGTLTMNGATLNFGNNGSAAGTKEVVNVDFSTLNAVNLGAATATINLGKGFNDGATLFLSNNSSTLTGSLLSIGDSSGQNYNLSYSSVLLGAGTNVIDADSIIIGTGKGRGKIDFQSAAGSLTIAGH